MRLGGILVGMRWPKPRSNEPALVGWLVSVKPILHGTEPVHFAAAFQTEEEAKSAVAESAVGRGHQVSVLRPLNVIEMMHLDMKRGEIRPHV
jgi:hypothetical protein